MIIILLFMAFGMMATPVFAKDEFVNFDSHVKGITIIYSKNRFNLSYGNRLALKVKIQEAQEEGVLSQVKILSWSDMELPETGRLNLFHRTLANRRIESIRPNVEVLISDGGKAEVYSMTTSTHWIGRNFYKTIPELKEAGEFNKADSMSREEYNFIKNNGESQRAIVIFRIERPVDHNISIEP